MMDRELAEWLFENGGPAIRYRTATELLDNPASVDLDRLTANLLESPLVAKWLERLGPDMSYTGIHHSKNTAYENAAGKLTQLGCRRGMPAFDCGMQPARNWLQREMESPSQREWGQFFRTIVASHLLRGGYCGDRAVREHIRRRLETLSDFASRGDYDIYIDQDTYPGFPKAFRRRPLIDPKLYDRDDMKLPSIHDINALAALPRDLCDESAARRIDTVMQYILHPDYQKLADGYGIVKGSGRRYYSAGWDVKLPGYFGLEASDRQIKYLIQRVVLMAHFRAARADRWFQECLAHLETYRTERGTYLFPRRYLQERTSGYWVTGAYMGLEESRRPKRAFELESTFWMLRVEKLAYGGAGQN